MWPVTCGQWHLTCDTLHVTCELRPVTCDLCFVPAGTKVGPDRLGSLVRVGSIRIKSDQVGLQQNTNKVEIAVEFVVRRSGIWDAKYTCWASASRIRCSDVLFRGCACWVSMLSRSDIGLLLSRHWSLLLFMFLFIITCHLIIGLTLNVSVQARAAVSLSSCTL